MRTAVTHLKAYVVELVDAVVAMEVMMAGVVVVIVDWDADFATLQLVVGMTAESAVAAATGVFVEPTPGVHRTLHVAKFRLKRLL